MNKRNAAFSLWFALLFCATVIGDPAIEPRFEGLGKFTRQISSTSPDARVYFVQGLAFMYAFNHDEAIRSFQQSTQIDPGSAISYWGIALANGPHINNPLLPANRAAAAWGALTEAHTLSGTASIVERALIDALATRYAMPSPTDRAPLDLAYAAAMRSVWRAFPQDADVGALFAEALADLRPWDLWAEDGAPEAGTEELIATLDAVLRLDPEHPLANHLYIHALEASPQPARADGAANRLRDLQPGLGHLVHMPSHIDVRRGRWQEAIVANAKAIEADRRYTARSAQPDFYRLYMAHNYHMLTYAAMMSGQSRQALESIRAMVADIPAQFIRDNAFADGLLAMPLEVQMRFGQWQAILEEPEYPDYAPFSRTLRHYARAVALAALGNRADARIEQQQFLTARQLVPAETTFGNNTATALLDVAQHLMNGEILYREGQVDAGIAELALAAGYEDQLRYDEPPGWIQPVRHPWGAALLQAGHIEQAEAVFRADLERQPNNGWGLYGLMRALQLQNETSEAEVVEQQFEVVWASADIRIKSACLCFPGV